MTLVMQPLTELRLPARADQLQALRTAVRAAARQCGCAPQLTDQLTLAVNEAAMNIIQHAYRDSTTGEIILEILNNDAALVFRLLDFAAPADSAAFKSRDLDDVRPGGLGLHLIRSVMDEVVYLPAPPGFGNLLQMTKKLVPESGLRNAGDTPN